MKWIDKLERRFGHIAIHDLMMIIVIGQAVVFLAEFFMPGLGIWSKLSLYMPAVLQGEVWRLLFFHAPFSCAYAVPDVAHWPYAGTELGRFPL